MHQISSESPEFYGEYYEKYFGFISSNWKNKYCRYLGYILSADVCYIAPLTMSKVDISGLKVGRFASEEVVISLIYAKCLPVLIYSTEACRILVRDKRSLEFTVARSLMKLFLAGSANIVQDCQCNLIDIRTARFLEDFIINENYVCRLFVRNARCSLDEIFSMYSDDTASTCNMRSVVSDTVPRLSEHYHYLPYSRLGRVGIWAVDSQESH